MPELKQKTVEIEVTNAAGTKETHKKDVPFPYFKDLKDVLEYATQNPTVVKPRGKNQDPSKNVILSAEMSIVRGYQAAVHNKIRLEETNKLEYEFGGFEKVLEAFALDIFQKRQKIGKPITMEVAREKAKAELADAS